MEQPVEICVHVDYSGEESCCRRMLASVQTLVWEILRLCFLMVGTIDLKDLVGKIAGHPYRPVA